MKILKYIISILIIANPAMIFTTAQNFTISRGMPFIKNYLPDEYGAHETNYDVLQAEDGTMYFANFSGILRFDGSSWTKIPTGSGMRVMSLCNDDNGKIYAAGLFDYGYLVNDTFGGTRFVSLVPASTKDNDIGLIFRVLIVKSEVLFFSENKFFVYNGKNIETKTLNGKLLSAFKVKDEVFLLFDITDNNQKLSGLYKYNAGEFNKIQTSNSQGIYDIEFIYPSVSENELLVGSASQGIFTLKNNVLSQTNWSANGFLNSNGLSCGIMVDKSTYAIGTESAGIVLTNQKGEIIQLIDQDSKLQDKSVNYLYLDKSGSLWALTDNGISKIEINWQLSYIDNKISGLSGKVNDIELFRDKLYCATEDGLYYLQGSTFKKWENRNEACLSLLKISDFLISATSRGIYYITGDKSKNSIDPGFTFCLVKSLKKNTVFYAGQNSKIAVFQINNKIELLKTIKNIPGDVMNIAEDISGDLHLEVSPGKIFIVKKNTNKAVEIGSNSDFLSMHLNSKNGTIFYSSEKGLFKANKGTNNFEPFNLCSNNSTSQKLWIHDLFEISKNQYLITNGEQKGLAFYSDRGDSYEINQTPFLPVAGFSVQTIWINPDKTQIWAGGKDGILISNYQVLVDYNAKYQTLIRKVAIIGKDTTLELLSDRIPTIDYVDNSIRFEYSLPVYPAAGIVEYRYFLDGFDKDTSDWTSQTKKEYTNLSDRNYEFIVEARNEFGKIALKSTFKFKILTPIYRQWWALLIYLIIVGALLRLFIVWRMRAGRKEKEKLEELVKERTEEIELSKVKLEEQRDIAYKHRKEILDSISYAQKIQQAVLPSQQYADDILLDHFIFYKPRDIVSGDFYWMKKLNNYIAVVAADCTGHGVPGAFMSMLGSSFLNEIVTRRSLDSASQILNRLRSKIKQSLHQEGKEGEQKDGMDIALFIIDNESLSLQYAGAYNPLYIIRPKKGVDVFDENIDSDLRYELIHLKADRQPIGIHLAEKEFTNHEFQLMNGDCLYSFSDGYVDQFGGETGEKFKIKRFKELLMSIQGKSMHEQKQLLEQAFVKWKRDLAQIDDVLVMGIKV